MKRLTLILVGLIGTAATGLAQTPNSTSWPPAAGARARIESPVLGVGRHVGTIESVTGDTLQFRRENGVHNVSLKPSEISTIELSAGKHTAKVKWAAIGVLVGGAAGFGIGATNYKECRDSFACIGDIGGRASSAGVGLIVGALTGGIAGALWGSRGHETWTPVNR